MSGFPLTLDRARVQRAMLSPLVAFQKNRKTAGDGLTVEGRPAGWTIFDRARAERNRLAVEGSEKALIRARSEQSRPYSLASEVALVIRHKVKRGISLVGAGGLACAGVALAIFSAIAANQPDSVLLQHAIEQARAHAPPSASHERELHFVMLGWGVVLLIFGILWLADWRKAPLGKPASK
jgi:stage V sporulation protein SpoVS